MPIGGTDAGAKILSWYEIVENHFPILADEPIIWPDTAAGTFGLAWCYGVDPITWQPIFAVRDDINVDTIPYVGFHESGHAFQNTIARAIAKKNGGDWLPEFDRIRERYWAFRGFPGTWWDGQLKANGGGGWAYYVDESFADAFAHMMLWLFPVPGYVTGEWTWNYGMTPSWQIQAQTYEFMRGLANEAGGDMTQDEVIALIEAKYGLTNTIQAIKDAIGAQAHHKHYVPAAAGTLSNEPE